MRKISAFALVVVLAMAFAAPAFAAGSSGTGLDFGTHHSTEAQTMGGFTATMNPGTHQGLSGWSM